MSVRLSPTHFGRRMLARQSRDGGQLSAAGEEHEHDTSRTGADGACDVRYLVWPGLRRAADDHTNAGTGIGCEAAEAAPGADRAWTARSRPSATGAERPRHQSRSWV